MERIESSPDELDPMPSSSISDALNDFRNVEFDLSKFSDSSRLNIQEENMPENDELVAMCLLANLGQHNDEPEKCLNKLLWAADYIFNGKNLSKLYEVRFSDKFKFPDFLFEQIKRENLGDQISTWREILSLSVIYALNPDVKEEAIALLKESDTAFHVIQRIFPEQKYIRGERIRR